MKNQARRDFLKKSLISMAGASMLPSAVSSASSRPEKPSENKLVFRTLGKTGSKVPIISMGTGNVNNPNLVKTACNSGIRLFFTATYYGEGNNEKMLGDALRDLPRDSFLVGTAVIPKGIDHKAGLYTKESTYEALMQTAGESLKRFGMEYVDIMLLPFAAKRESVFFEPLLRAMEDLKKQGKTRFVGIASHSFSDQALRAAADTKVYDVAMVAYNFKSAGDTSIQDAIAYAAHEGIGIMAMKTQAGGFWDKERQQPINHTAALKWVLQNENISTIVSGMTKFEELQHNLTLMMNDLKPTDQELKDLKLSSLNAQPGLYCNQCHQCISQCPKGLDIPSLMRSYMYAYGYRDLLHAHDTLLSSRLPESVCADCTTCQVHCPAGFNVRARITDIARLRDVPSDFLQV